VNKNPPQAGQDYWPDQTEWPSQATPKPRSLITQALLFMLVFALLQVSWLLVRDHSVGHFIRGDMTVKPAVALINWLSPQIKASALGNQIIASGGGLVVKLGCEGVEALFILLAAFVTAPLSRSAMLKGMLLGTLFVYAFNQTRILTLFYAFRADKSLFQLLHGTVAPLTLIALVALFFHYWLIKHSNTNASQAA
jgi:exosortase/archaeosortase family protein